MMQWMHTRLSRFTTLQRVGWLSGAVLAVAVPALLFWWWSRADYQALFEGLDARDAAMVISSLEKQKVPYQLVDDGATVLVEQASLYKTRMQLMGSGLDLKGTVGFELFNDTKFGMTEFTQKINYQRALEGELARTILGFDEVRNARVHLVLPNRGLLKKANDKAKASVWVTLNGGKHLLPEQVTGIQRLVAAAAPDMSADAVTVLDQRGQVLSTPIQDDEGLPSGDSSLQLKKQTEAYLAQKVSRILQTALGEHQVAVGVNVVLERTAVKTQRESVVGDGPTGSTGILVRQSEQWTHKPGAATAQPADTAIDALPSRPASRTVDVEYQVGKEVRQTRSSMGAIKRMSLGIVTAAPLSDAMVEQLTPVIAMAVGLDTQRGDEMAFSVVKPRTPVPPVTASSSPPPSQAMPSWLLPAFSLLAALALVCGLAVWIRYRQTRCLPVLSIEEREQVLSQVRHWLNEAPLREEQST